MSQLTKKYLPILKRINKMADKNRKEYLRKCNREFIDYLSECATNVLRGNVPLTSRQGEKLKRNKKRPSSTVGKEDVAQKETSHRSEGRFSRCSTDTCTAIVGWTHQ